MERAAVSSGERAVVMRRDREGRDTPASNELSHEGAAWEKLRLQAADPDSFFWTQPAPRPAS